MASFEILGGDFPSEYGIFAFDELNMPIKGSVFKKEKIHKSQIESVEMATEESVKKLSSTLGWTAVGALTLGPIGAVAGLFLGGKKKKVVFICHLKDGRKFMAESDAKVFTKFQAACL